MIIAYSDSAFVYKGLAVQKQVTYETVPLTELPEDLDKVYRYWSSLRSDSSIPSWKQFDLQQIPGRLLPFTLVKDIEYPGPLFRYRFFGSGIARAVGSDLTGLSTEDIPSPSLAEAVNTSLKEYLSDPGPRYYRLHSAFSPDDQPVQIQLRLPLADNGNVMDKVVSVLKHFVSVWDYSKVLPPKEK